MGETGNVITLVLILAGGGFFCFAVGVVYGKLMTEKYGSKWGKEP